jgi:phosphatidylglycerophosphate synthase
MRDALTTASTIAPEPAGLGRRPIRARDSSRAVSLATWLAHLGVQPNQISLVGIGVSLLVAAVLALAGLTGGTRPWLLIAAAAGIQLRLLANLLDGMVAIEGGRRSPLGDLYNDVPDRVSDALILGGAGYAAGLGWGVELGWVAAVLAVMTAYVRTLAGSLGSPGLFLGPMAKPQRMAVLTLGCLAAAVEALVAAPPRAIAWSLGVIAAGCLITIARRLARVARHLDAR